MAVIAVVWITAMCLDSHLLLQGLKLLFLLGLRRPGCLRWPCLGHAGQGRMGLGLGSLGMGRLRMGRARRHWRRLQQLVIQLL